jgi:hypothetical protein
MEPGHTDSPHQQRCLEQQGDRQAAVWQVGRGGHNLVGDWLVN